MSKKEAVRELYNRLFVKSDGFVRYLRDKGVAIGEDVTFHSPRISHVDITAPHLLTIGDHVNLTGPISILTHDYSWSVIKGLTGEILGNQKPVNIGNNVFVGWGATILCGTIIEDNTIIGAHVVVSGRVTGDSVWGGARSPHLLAGTLPREASGRSGRGGQRVRARLPRALGPRPARGGGAGVLLPVRGPRQPQPHLQGSDEAHGHLGEERDRLARRATVPELREVS